MADAPDNSPAVDLVDTHCHLNFDSYAEDLDAVLTRSAQAGVRRIINPGVDAESSRAAIDLARRYPGVIYAAVGIHPNDTAAFSQAQLDEEIAPLARAEGVSVVAIGEIGLDYYWDKSPKDQQKRAFEAQLTLAKALELPVIIHNREASDDVMDILEAWSNDLPPSFRARPGGIGVLHSFSATRAIATRALEAGFCLGFTGPITFKNAEDTRRVAAMTPLERILVETDGPFLTPMPYRGKRNEPAYIPYIVERLAAVKGIDVTEMGAASTQNAERLFGL